MILSISRLLRFIAIVVIILSSASVIAYWSVIESTLSWVWSGTLEDVRNRTFIFATFIGLFFIALRTVAVNRSSKAAIEQVILTRKGNLTDRFTKSVDLIGSDSTSTVVGGVFALEQIAQEEPEIYHNVIMEILTGFIREQAHFSYKELQTEVKEAGSGKDYQEPKADIQAALTVIGRRNNIDLENGKRWYLWRTNLRSMNFTDGNFDNFNFYSCNLINAKMNGTSLKGTILISAVLIEARLIGAILDATILQDTIFSHADFHNATIKNTDCGKIIGYDKRSFSDTNFDNVSSGSLPKSNT